MMLAKEADDLCLMGFLLPLCRLRLDYKADYQGELMRRSGLRHLLLVSLVGG